MKTHELEIKETVNGLTDVDLQVEYTPSGEIVEIRVYSFHLIDWIPVQDYIKANWPGKYQAIQDLVFEQLNDKPAA